MQVKMYIISPFCEVSSGRLQEHIRLVIFTMMAKSGGGPLGAVAIWKDIADVVIAHYFPRVIYIEFIMKIHYLAIYNR